MGWEVDGREHEPAAVTISPSGRASQQKGPHPRQCHELLGERPRALTLTVQAGLRHWAGKVLMTPSCLHSSPAVAAPEWGLCPLGLTREVLLRSNSCSHLDKSFLAFPFLPFSVAPSCRCRLAWVWFVAELAGCADFFWFSPHIIPL